MVDEHGAVVELYWHRNTCVLCCQRETCPSAAASIRNPTGAGLVFEPGPKIGPCYVVFLVYRHATIILPRFTAITLPTGAGLVFEPRPKVGPCYVVFRVYRHATIILPRFTAITRRSKERRQQNTLGTLTSFPLYRLFASETGKRTMISCSQVSFRTAVPLPVRRLRNRVTVLLSVVSCAYTFLSRDNQFKPDL